ncbi:hypothetical protein A3L04_08675 [Thermococcus chitonophagus]|uniref:M23ase beta-sheet core domain-containing protein n=1 Tax=Thermococcus chitonophagus TaxID=54262 RepID=A0A2Z2NHC9_9EURY|nr:M23 family metallopeptidase [Thermococcus chitonophagus]ASJ17136.1 hypothetical protein A3L04_08675 [Thermococcus chitonophagus]
MEDSSKLENPCSYKQLDEWATYGSEVVAVADGIVVDVSDGMKDNPVGRISLSVKEILGNYVVIDHGGVYSLYAHLKNGSVSVRPGERVKAGTVIGLAGNSGMSSFPHLHFQLMDREDFYDAVSLPVLMQYTVEGKNCKKYPSKNEIICGLDPQIHPIP